jgi:hypothetical protein
MGTGFKHLFHLNWQAFRTLSAIFTSRYQTTVKSHNTKVTLANTYYEYGKYNNELLQL